MATHVSFHGLRYILQRVGLFAVFGAALFGAAGTLDWPRGWAALGASFACELLVLGILAFQAPETLNQRGTRHAGVKTFDKVFMVTWMTLSLVFAVVVGLDCVRYGWSALPWSTFAVGVGLLVAATSIGTWAMVENEHFEQCVRIQSDRSHRVVTTGPYRVVRHPGYISFLLSTLAGPLLFGSAWSTVPVGLLVILFLWRTSREDATLQKELDGYAEYAEQTPYRLIPFIW